MPVCHPAQRAFRTGFDCLLWGIVFLFCIHVLTVRTVHATEQPPSEAVSAQIPVRILLQWIPQAQFSGFIMAQEKGFFQEEHLAVELHWANTGETSLTRLGTEMDFVAAWLVTALQRRAEGIPLVNIAQFMQHSATMVVARRDRGIKTLEDLDGKIFLSWGGDFSLEFELFLKYNNIHPSKVLPLGASLAPFLYGLVDAVQVMEYSEYQRLLERGMKPEEMIVFPFAKHKVNLIGDGLYTTQSYLKNNRETVRAVRRAVLRGWEYAFAHEEETIQCVLRYSDAWGFRTNKYYQLKMLHIVHKLMRPQEDAEHQEWGYLSRKDFEHARSIAEDAGLPVQNERYETFFQEP